MQTIDPKLQSEVWRRVMGRAEPAVATAGEADMSTDGTSSGTAATTTTATPMAADAAANDAGANGTLTAEAVLGLIQWEKDDCATYRYLARRACGCDATALLRMAEDAACHSRKLQAMYYLLTGKCTCPQPATPACAPCLTEALRERYDRAIAAAEAYRDAAKAWPAMSCEFLSMAEDEYCRSKQLYSMICRRL